MGTVFLTSANVMIINDVGEGNWGKKLEALQEKINSKMPSQEKINFNRPSPRKDNHKRPPPGKNQIFFIFMREKKSALFD